MADEIRCVTKNILGHLCSFIKSNKKKLYIKMKTLKQNKSWIILNNKITILCLEYQFKKKVKVNYWHNFGTNKNIKAILSVLDW